MVAPWGVKVIHPKNPKKITTDTITTKLLRIIAILKKRTTSNKYFCMKDDGNEEGQQFNCEKL